MRANEIVRDLTKILEDAKVAFELRRTGKGHYQFVFQAGQMRCCYVVPGTTSCSRAAANARAGVRRLLRQNGVDV